MFSWSAVTWRYSRYYSRLLTILGQSFSKAVLRAWVKTGKALLVSAGGGRKAVDASW
jgi:hypothetical protein